MEAASGSPREADEKASIEIMRIASKKRRPSDLAKIGGPLRRSTKRRVGADGEGDGLSALAEAEMLIEISSAHERRRVMAANNGRAPSPSLLPPATTLPDGVMVEKGTVFDPSSLMSGVPVHTKLTAKEVFNKDTRHCYVNDGLQKENERLACLWDDGTFKTANRKRLMAETAAWRAKACIPAKLRMEEGGAARGGMETGRCEGEASNRRLNIHREEETVREGGRVGLDDTADLSGEARTEEGGDGRGEGGGRGGSKEEGDGGLGDRPKNPERPRSGTRTFAAAELALLTTAARRAWGCRRRLSLSERSARDAKVPDDRVKISFHLAEKCPQCSTLQHSGTHALQHQHLRRPLTSGGRKSRRPPRSSLRRRRASKTATTAYKVPKAKRAEIERRLAAHNAPMIGGVDELEDLLRGHEAATSNQLIDLANKTMEAPLSPARPATAAQQPYSAVTAYQAVNSVAAAHEQDRRFWVSRLEASKGRLGAIRSRFQRAGQSRPPQFPFAAAHAAAAAAAAEAAFAAVERSLGVRRASANGFLSTIHKMRPLRRL